MWDYWTFTPLERPAEHADKATLSDAEHAELLKRLSGQAAAIDARSPAAGDPGAYSQEVWTERARGTALKQTSIIIEPENGRIPPMTPEAEAKVKAYRDYQLALLQATDTCKRKLSACRDGEYNPTPSPKRNTPALNVIGPAPASALRLVSVSVPAPSFTNPPLPLKVPS